MLLYAMRGSALASRTHHRQDAPNRGHGRQGGSRMLPWMASWPTLSSAASATAARQELQAAPRTEQQQAFEELLSQQASSSSVVLEPSSHGYGLYLARDVTKGDVVLSVPTSACLVVDYRAGLGLPQAAWPRLRKGLQKDDSTPWDLLLALALLDGLSGAGGTFWESYTNTLLPQPTQLALPSCLPDPGLLGELQHGAIIEGARAQKARLRGLFPGISGAMCEGGPTWLEWGFGCVRRRALKLGDESFAFVPFLDLANHAPEPTCDFRLAPGGRSVDLVAVKDTKAGQEATVSYTGPQGMTNQRLMAQYGFVPPQGNTADRLAFAALPPTADAASLPGGASSASPAAAAAMAAASSSGGGPTVLLSVDRLQACLGDGQLMAAAFSGRDPYLYAALKSLPLALEEGQAASWQRQAALAGALLAELEAERSGWATSPAQDKDLLSSLAGLEATAGAAGSETSSSGSNSADAASSTDSRLEPVVLYRLQRKLLVGAGSLLLRRFLDS